MADRTDQIIAEITAVREELAESIRAFPDSTFSLRPGPDAWSAGETANHLAVVEKSVAAVLRRLLERAKEEGKIKREEKKEDEGANVTLPPLPSERIDAPQRFLPEQPLSKSEALEALAASRGELLEIVEESRRFDLHDAIFPHRILGDLTFYQWILFIGAHERRHIAQVGSVRKQTDAAA